MRKSIGNLFIFGMFHNLWISEANINPYSTTNNCFLKYWVNLNEIKKKFWRVLFKNKVIQYLNFWEKKLDFETFPTIESKSAGAMLNFLKFAELNEFLHKKLNVPSISVEKW